MTTLHNGLSEVKIKYISEYLQPESVLDLGAGSGQYSRFIQTKFPTSSILATDLFLPAEKTSFPFQQINLETETLTVTDHAFSSIIAFDILEHVENIDQLMSEVYRTLKPGGILIGSVPHDDDRFLPAYNLTFYHRSDVTHKRYYRLETLEQLLKKHHFTQIKLWLEGGVNPQVIAEFFPKKTEFIIKKIVGLFRRLGIISTHALKSDIFFVASKE